MGVGTFYLMLIVSQSFPQVSVILGGGAETAINIPNKQTMVPREALCSVNVQDGVELILSRTELVM